MSAPPIGMISVMPKTKAEHRDRPERPGRLRASRNRRSARRCAAKIRMFSSMARGQQDRRAAHVAVELGEGDDRAGEGDRADGDAEAHLDQALRADRAFRADAEGLRRIERRAARPARRPGRRANGTPRRAAASSVMAMRRAVTAPMPPPMARPPTISAQVSGSVTPRDPQRGRRSRAPCRSCRCGCPRATSPGDDSPRSARMNRTPETR